MNSKNGNDVIKGNAAKANVYAYSREAFDGLLLGGFVLGGCLAMLLLAAYICGDGTFRDRGMFQFIILFFVICLLAIIHIHYIELMMFIDIRRGDVDEKVFRLVDLNVERVESARWHHSRVEKYFYKGLHVGKYMIKCACKDAKKFRIRTILSWENLILFPDVLLKMKLRWK